MIKPQGNKEGFYQATVRFSSQTTFDQLKTFICNFWVKIIKNYYIKGNFVKKLQKLPNKDPKTGQEFAYIVTDESHNQIFEEELVEKFFLQKSSAEFNQAMILIKLKSAYQSNLNGPQEESII